MARSTCGVADPLGESEMHRVCHTYMFELPRPRDSGADTAGGKSEKRDSSGGKGKGPAGTSSGVKPNTGSMDAVERWLSVEENEEIAKGIVADMVEDLCDENLVQLDLASDDDVDEAKQGEAGQSSGAAAPPPPAHSGVAEHFCEHEDTAETCGMSEASYHLRKAKLAWMSAYGSRETKQTCMRDFL